MLLSSDSEADIPEEEDNLPGGRDDILPAGHQAIIIADPKNPEVVPQVPVLQPIPEDQEDQEQGQGNAEEPNNAPQQPENPRTKTKRKTKKTTTKETTPGVYIVHPGLRGKFSHRRPWFCQEAQPRHFQFSSVARKWVVIPFDPLLSCSPEEWTG